MHGGQLPNDGVRSQGRRAGAGTGPPPPPLSGAHLSNHVWHSVAVADVRHILGDDGAAVQVCTGRHRKGRGAAGVRVWTRQRQRLALWRSGGSGTSRWQQRLGGTWHLRCSPEVA
mgnify:CR=1 FL=1